MPSEPLGPHDWDAELLAAVAETQARARRRQILETVEAALWAVGTIAICLLVFWGALIGF